MLVPTIAMLGGFLMPMIGLGTWLATNETQLETALDTALEAGYRHFDTAFIYKNEHVIGKVLKRWFDSGKLKREDVFITTKLPMMGIHVDRVEHFMNKSLENLGLDYVDLYLIHFPVGIKYLSDELQFNKQTEFETSEHVDLWKKMEEQVDAGRAKTIGVSNFNKSQVERIINSARIKPACIQVELHVRLQQKELVDFCQKNGMVVVGYSPLGNPSFNDLLSSLGMEKRNITSLLDDKVVNEIAKKHNKKPSHILLRFLVEKNIVPIPKSVTPSRIVDNIKIFDFSLDQTDLKKLEALDMGEDGRILDFKFVPELQDHPEYPWANRSRPHHH